jgi:iron complex transport system substrate-binding protein
VAVVAIVHGRFGQTEPRIVSLSPSSTEILYAVHAGREVVAVDEYSDAPVEARGKSDPKLSGWGTRVGEVMKYNPDVVIVPGYGGVEGDRSIVVALRRRGVDVVVDYAPRDLAGVYSRIELLGQKAHRQREASALVRSMKAEIAAIVRTAPKATGLSYYHEVDASYHSVTSRTFAGAAYALFGLDNIADGSDFDGTGYPQLTRGQIVSADPDLIFLADARWGENDDTVRVRKGWQKIAAVRSGKVFELDDDLCSRWGPRLVDFVRKIAVIIREES